jgi:ribose transport system ATP-binding protein
VTDALLQMTGIVKQFPGVRALDGVDLDVRRGEVHCLLGQNGAGKSTLIKVLSGAHQPDEGEIRWKGEVVTFPLPVDALRAGLATIYQELDLVPGLTVADNIFLGHERARGGFVRRGEMNDAARALLKRLGHGEIRPTQEVGSLSAAGQQIVSMARALSHEAQLIVMDEPSAVLDADEVGNLFRVISELTGQGVAIVYISHRLDEIRQIGDRVTVLKDGRTVATGIDAQETPTRELVSLMTGRDIEFVFPDRPAAVAADAPEAPEVLRVEGLSREGEFSDVSFTVRAGEIVGLAGLVGAGRSEILETIYGARKPTAGRVVLDGTPLTPGSVTAAVDAGMGLAPEERKSQALLLEDPIFRNVSLASLARYGTAGFIGPSAELDDVEQVTRKLDMRPPDGRRLVRQLSGGNQQKAVVARWLLKGCRVLLLDEPTRGVDVGARSELYAVVRELADSGVAVVMVSSEVPEVLGLADRVLVIKEGTVVHEGPAAEIDEAQVLSLVVHGSGEEAA